MWPCHPVMGGCLVPVGCSYQGAKQTGHRMSGSGCWRARDKTSTSPIGKYAAVCSNIAPGKYLYITWPVYFYNR